MLLIPVVYLAGAFVAGVNLKNIDFMPTQDGRIVTPKWWFKSGLVLTSFLGVGFISRLGNQRLSKKQPTEQNWYLPQHLHRFFQTFMSPQELNDPSDVKTVTLT